MRSASRVHLGVPNRDSKRPYGVEGTQRRAVGYIRVSTDMQAADGLSLDAQQRVEDEAEQSVIAQLRLWALDGVKVTEMARRLNAKCMDSSDRVTPRRS